MKPTKQSLDTFIRASGIEESLANFNRMATRESASEEVRAIINNELSIFHLKLAITIGNIYTQEEIDISNQFYQDHPSIAKKGIQISSKLPSLVTDCYEIIESEVSAQLEEERARLN